MASLGIRVEVGSFWIVYYYGWECLRTKYAGPPALSQILNVAQEICVLVAVYGRRMPGEQGR